MIHMRRMMGWLVMLGALLGGCTHRAEPDADATVSSVVAIPASIQRTGDPDAGRDFLLYGDYIGSGIPFDLYRRLLGLRKTPNPWVERTGRAGLLPESFNLFTDREGAEMVSGVNCLGCHASRFGDEYIIGLGNSFADWTPSDPFPDLPLRAAGAIAYPDASSPERRSLRRFLRGVRALGNDADTPFMGVNPAFRVEELAAAHRDPETLRWVEEHVFEVPERRIATDVPPWWHLKKKHALYYNGMGRGDFAKLIQQITVVGIEDVRAAEEIHAGMTDLLAYLRTIEPPAYPHPIDPDLSARGRDVFENTCASCHGTYGAGRGDPAWTYPNRLVPVEIVGTDAAYARTLVTTGLTEWYNRSWFATSEPRSRVEPTMAYIAPPLDGVWMSAPYLHNGSVPTLEALLNSSTRPTYWRRSFDASDYDFERVGWGYTVPEEHTPGDIRTYDTTLEGYGNQGHTFGDALTDEERRAVIEYLKSL